MRIFAAIVLPIVLVLAMPACEKAEGGQIDFDAWTTLTPDSDLAGWRISDSNGHGDTKGWTVADGTVTGTQDREGNGGILLSEATFGDFIMELELNPDWGLDSGIFLRSTPSGQCYQIMVDYYEGGNVGGIYGEGTGGFFAGAIDWETHYKKEDWNKILTVVEGNPPHIDVWLNGHHVMSWAGKEKLLDDTGHIALQVHAGDRYFGKETRFRNIRIRSLK
jgi:hypothetical protein